MTIEQRNSIGLDDIEAIEYVCGHCKSIFAVPLDKVDRVLQSCPNCNEQLIDIRQHASNEPSDYLAVGGLVNWIISFRKRGVPIRLRLSSSARVSSEREN